MSQIRARLAALRARREQATACKPVQEVERRHSLGAHTATHARLEWRERARQAASERIRRAVLESGVYDVITRPLPQEKDDIEELEKRKIEEAQSDVEEDDDDDDDDAGEEEKDEEEAALERLEKGIVSDVDSCDAGTRDADTRDELARDEAANRQVDDSPTVPDSGDQERSPADGHKREKDDANEGTTPAPTSIDESNKETEEEQQPSSADKQLPISETGPATPESKPTIPISETGPEVLTPSSDPQGITPPRNPLGMVEDEAEDDEDQEKDEDGSPDLSGDDVNDIVPDADVAEADAAKLAEFHRKWEAEQMEPAAPRYDDLDDAMDFTDVKAVGDDNISAEVGDDGVCAEGGDHAADRAENYIDAMFLRDDSKSKVVDIEEDDDAGDETTREKARALWKARQMFRMRLRERDESDSLSRFDLFNDSQNRSADIRSRLEQSCRPAPLRDVTNVNKSKKRKLEPPEWARRREILAQKERKRHRAVSVGNWSFTMYGKREEAAVKKTSVRPSLGAAHLTKRSRSRKAATPPRRKPSIAVVKKRRSGAASFKGLLSVLGKQAKVDPSR